MLPPLRALQAVAKSCPTITGSVLRRDGPRPAPGRRVRGRREIYFTRRFAGPTTILDVIARVPGHLADGCSRYQAVAPRLRHQDLGARRVALDLLAKAVHMGLQRVRRHSRIVAPYFAEKSVAPDRLIAGAVEIFQDRRLFLGQPNLLAAGRIEQELGARTERVGADREHRVVAVLALPQMGAQPGQQHAQAKRLRHIVGGARIAAEHGVLNTVHPTTPESCHLPPPPT